MMRYVCDWCGMLIDKDRDVNGKYCRNCADTVIHDMLSKCLAFHYNACYNLEFVRLILKKTEELYAVVRECERCESKYGGRK